MIWLCEYIYECNCENLLSIIVSFAYDFKYIECKLQSMF